MATIARAKPLLIENSEASAAQAMRSDAAMTAPNVEIATAYSWPGASSATRIAATIQTERTAYSTSTLVIAVTPLPGQMPS